MENLIGHIISNLVVVIPCFGLSYAYFYAGRGKSYFSRIVKSAHGILFIAGYGYAVIASGYTSVGQVGDWAIPYHAIWILAIVSILLSFIKYVDWRWHFLYLLGLPIGFFIWLWGSMVIWHDSL